MQSQSTWIDPQTGLEWQIDSPGIMTWDEAMAYADGLSLNGSDDWRMPTCAEIESLLDRSVYRPQMRKEVPFRDTRSYWTSSTLGGKLNSAWMVMFDGAYVLSYFKTNAYHVRCIRG
jgi:formylglycine-generating enzyme required for sulfatase activity